MATTEDTVLETVRRSDGPTAQSDDQVVRPSDVPRRRIGAVIAIVLVLIAVVFGIRRWRWGLTHEKTDDAQVDGHVIPVLAKVLYQTNPNVDARIQLYNQVINELIVANRLTVTPADFYNFFKTNPSQLGDGLHPNGVGYQSMSPLWYNSLVGVVFP